MPTGLRMPVGVNSRGGAWLVSKDENSHKIIALALSDLENDNAFQQNIGLGGGAIFDVAGQTYRAQIRQKVVDIFKDFEDQKLYSLDTTSLKFNRGAPGEQILDFAYINLETDQRVVFSQKLLAKGTR